MNKSSRTYTISRRRFLFLAIPAFFLVAISGIVLWREYRQHEILASQAIGNDGIDADEVIDINGTRQAIQIRGQDKDAPVLLWVHGGPGYATMPFYYEFGPPLEKNFIVVHWDQRGAGKSYRLNDPDAIAKTLKWEQMLDDTEAVLEYLHERFDGRKIVYVGHSWGSMLGTAIAHKRPDLLSVYVGTGQVVNMVDGERIGYEHTLAEVRRLGWAQDEQTLLKIAPYPDDTMIMGEKHEVLREIQGRLGYFAWRTKNPNWEMFRSAFYSPAYSLGDIIAMLQGIELSEPLNASNMWYDAKSFGQTFEVPVVYLVGRKDWLTPQPGLLEEYFEWIEAPSKQLIWFENSSHAPMFDEPEAFGQAMAKHVLPLAEKTPAKRQNNQRGQD
jgi:proline iminopeptidase